MSSLRFALGLGSAISLLAAAAPAQPGATQKQIKQQCAAAYVEAQTLRKQGSLLSARDQLITCGRDECAAAIKNECAQWLSEVNAGIPSIVVAAKDRNGKETLAIKVHVGGSLIKDGLDAKAIELDPGSHVLRLELEGEPPIEQEIVLQEGRKHRLVEVSWQQDSSPVAAPEPEPDLAPDPPVAAAGPPVLAYVLVGVGAVALVGTGYFWLTAASEKSDLDGCKPACDQADVDSVEQKRLFGDIALGVGIVSLAAATYLWLGSSSPPPAAETSRAPRFDVRAGPGGAFASLHARF
jgi:hypothetical protein